MIILTKILIHSTTAPCPWDLPPFVIDSLRIISIRSALLAMYPSLENVQRLYGNLTLAASHATSGVPSTTFTASAVTSERVPYNTLAASPAT
jgi:hypothetical protein